MSPSACALLVRGGATSSSEICVPGSSRRARRVARLPCCTGLARRAGLAGEVLRR